MTSPDLVLVVPCYNEAHRLREDQFLAFVRQRPGVRLLMVDDGSQDATGEVHARLAAAAPGSVASMRLEQNQGKAEAVRQGVVRALGEPTRFVGYWDADLATPLDAADDFLRVAAQRPQAEVFLGSRVMLMGRDIRRNPWRHYAGRVFATAASLTLGLPVYDTQCGAKMFRATAGIAEVFSRPFISRWVFDVEVLSRYLALPTDGAECPRHERIYEIALRTWHDVEGSKVRPRDFISGMVDLAAIARQRRAWARRAAGGGSRTQ